MRLTPKPQVHPEALILDLFGVVISFDDNIVYRRLAQACAEPTHAFAGMQGLVSRPDLIRGRQTLEQLHQELATTYGLSLGLNEFDSAWLAPYSEPMPGMAELLAALSHRYKLVLLSNVDAYYWKTIRREHREIELFSDILLSCDLGVAKPERAAFLRAIDAAGAPASSCFFVDDKDENVLAAKQVGINAHRFVGASDLRSVLAQQGVLPNDTQL